MQTLEAIELGLTAHCLSVVGQVAIPTLRVQPVNPSAEPALPPCMARPLSSFFYTSLLFSPLLGTRPVHDTPGHIPQWDPVVTDG